MIRQLTLQLLIILAVGSLPFHRSLKGPYISVGGGFLVSPAVAQNITSTNDTVADETTLLEQCDTAQRNINLLAWSQTDFNRCTVRLDEIISGGLGKDGIPSIDNPMIIAADRAGDLTPKGPVISLSINGEARAWPLRYLIWHEIVNDELGGVPIAVTYCPLCNATLVFDRRLDGQVLDFGTTGNLRKSDLVMYDRQTESWWQQYTGTDIIGTHAGRSLTVLASRLESWQQFSLRHPGGYLPSLSQLTTAIEQTDLVISDIEVLFLHYAETLRHWRKRFLHNRQQAVELKDEYFARIWEFYLAASEAAFRNGNLVVFQIQVKKPGAKPPATRDYIYS